LSSHPPTTAAQIPSRSARHERPRDAGRGTGLRLDVQGLRAVAVLVVVAFHAGLPLPGGFVGVDVFFVISGFVITAMLQRQWAATGRIDFVRFYTRRFKRLIPALALVVTVTLAASAFLLSPLGPQQTAAKTGLGAMLLSANYVIAATTGGYFDAPAAINPLLHTWSLSVEEQFYLAFPAILAIGWVIARRRRSRVSIYLFVGAIAAASYALAVAGSSGRFGDAEVAGFYSSLTRAWEFSVGALVCLALPLLATLPRAAARMLGLVGGALLAASIFVISEATPFPGHWTLIPVIGTALVIVAGAGQSRGLTRALASPPMVRIGDWSYSIYLWHWPFIVFAEILWPDVPWAPLAAAVLCFIPAILSYYALEQPIRAIRALSPARFAGLVGLTLAPPLLLAGFLLWSNAGPTEEPPDDGGGVAQPVRQEDLYAAAASFHMSNEAGCHTPVPISERSASDCTWNEFSDGVPIYLVGDSNGDHFSEAVIGSAYGLDRPVTIATIDTCPFLDAYVVRESGPDPFLEPCRDYFEATYSWLQDQQPGLVIISNSDEVYLDPDVALGLDPESLSTDLEEKVQSRADGLTDVVSTLQAAGHVVLLVQAVPHWVPPYAYEPGLCSAGAIHGGTCGETMPRSFAADLQGPPREGLQEAADRTGTDVLDVWDDLCDADTCFTRNDDMVLYRDSFHISVPASDALVPVFERAIDAAGVPSD